jgi:predicted cobalt transporter CbtA
VVQPVRVTPLILEAETYEHAGGLVHAHEGPGAPAGQHAGPTEIAAEDAGWTPERTLARTAFTVVANMIAAVGFAMLLTVAFALRGGADWYRGLIWGSSDSPHSRSPHRSA